MKKLAALLILAMLLALPLAGCDMDIVSTPDTTLSGQESPSIDYDAMSEEDAMVRRITDPVIMDVYGFTDLSIFEIKIWSSVGKYGARYEARYYVKIQNYTSREEYRVTLWSDDPTEKPTVSEYTASDYRKYLPYLEVATEEAVRQAEEKLDERMKGLNGENSGYYLSIDYEGNLCLNCEYAGHGQGEVCHGHALYSEIICPKP